MLELIPFTGTSRLTFVSYKYSRITLPVSILADNWF